MKSNTYHLHLETENHRPALFHIPESEWLAAAPRYKRLAKKLKVTIGWDRNIRDQALKTADFLITNGVPPRDNLRARAPRLKWIQTTAAGVDWLLPFDWLPREVVLTNNRGAHGPKAFETVTMALLMLQQRMPALLAHQASRKWQAIYTPPITGKTAVVVGFGDLGENSGRAAKALGMTVIAVTRSGVLHKSANQYADRVVKTARLESVLPRADYLVVTTPLTTETRGLISKARLDLLKPHAGIINIGRAPIIDYEALRSKLDNGEIAGAVLDVFDTEPLPPKSPWWRTKNTIVLPHLSCDDPRYIQRLFDSWFGNFDRFLSGKPLKNIVDRKLGY